MNRAYEGFRLLSRKLRFAKKRPHCPALQFLGNSSVLERAEKPFGHLPLPQGLRPSLQKEGVPAGYPARNPGDPGPLTAAFTSVLPKGPMPVLEEDAQAVDPLSHLDHEGFQPVAPPHHGITVGRLGELEDRSWSSSSTTSFSSGLEPVRARLLFPPRAWSWTS